MKKFIKINPNEFGGLLYGYEELNEIQKVLFTKKIFRYASRKRSVTDQFETSVKNYLKIKYALGFNNGTSALKAALFAVGVKPGDRVLISCYTFIATAASVINIGAIPVPIDFDLVNCLNIKDLKKEIKKGCQAIIPVHLQGRTFDITPILQLAKKGNIPVIEDSCQAFGSKYKDMFAGCRGDIGVYSFQQYKQISAGEGGLLVTNNEQYYKIAKNYSDHGIVRESMTWDDPSAVVGDNYRINNLQSAILKIQMKRLRTMIKSQVKNRKYILMKIKRKKINSILNSPDIIGETGMNIFFLCESKEKANLIISHSRSNNIEFRRLWDKPYYLHGVFQRLKLTPHQLQKNSCTIAEDISERLLSVSIPPTLTTGNLDKIVREITQLCKLNYLS